MKRLVVRFLRWVLDRMTHKGEFRLPVEKHELLGKHMVSVVLPQGVPLFVQIGSHDGVEHHTWALIEHSIDDTAAFLWFIFTPEHDRRKGYAKELLRILQTRYDRIETDYTSDILNSAGTLLCLKCGFVPVKSLFKKTPHRLVWKKANDA